jgi:SAM-dependent methyltransferase
MNETFTPVYADSYDLLYQEKDYPGECDVIERIVKTYSDRPISSFLDLGCGTGNHAHLLGLRGYEVVGVDESAEMLEKAHEKAQRLSLGHHVTFLRADLCEVALERHFSAALMMFAVLGYQTHNSDVLRALKVARRHLLPGGVLLFDVWYGPAVLHQRPVQRVNIIPTPRGGQILRMGNGALDIRRHLCTVDYEIWQIQDASITARAHETHSMRYFFPMELELFLEQSGFEVIRLGPFPHFARELDETTWNLLAVARAV